MADILTGQDKAIADMIAAKPTQSAIDVNDLKNPSDFDLPKECVQFADRFDFRWLSKDTRMLDRAINVKGWTIVNRTCDIKLPEYMFRAHGGVEKRSMILAYRGKAVGDMFKKASQSQSIENIKKARKDEERDKETSPFYTAKLSGAEEAETTTDEAVQGRDF